MFLFSLHLGNCFYLINMSVLPRWPSFKLPPFEANYIIAITDIKKKQRQKKPLRSIITLKNGWKNINPHFTKGTTQVHTTKLYEVTSSKFRLLQRWRQHTRSWRLLCHPVHSTHPVLHCIHSPMQKQVGIHTMMSDVCWFPQYNRKLDISIKKVKWHLLSDDR